MYAIIKDGEEIFNNTSFQEVALKLNKELSLASESPLNVKALSYETLWLQWDNGIFKIELKSDPALDKVKDEVTKYFRYLVIHQDNIENTKNEGLSELIVSTIFIRCLTNPLFLTDYLGINSVVIYQAFVLFLNKTLEPYEGFHLVDSDPIINDFSRGNNLEKRIFQRIILFYLKSKGLTPYTFKYNN